jgi:CubicO group peptidase (beta-lactamase class C family)
VVFKYHNRFFGRVVSSVIIAIIALSLFSCGGANSEPTNTQVAQEAPPPISFSPLSSQITTATANEVGFDNAKISDVYQQAALDPDIYSLLVLKDGHLIAESYFNGANQDSLLQIRSSTKTVLAMLMGIALDQGLFIGTEQTIGEFIGNDYPELSADKLDITLESLLTMSSGFNWDEGLYLEWESSGDPLNFLLSRELDARPNQIFNYNSAAVHLLSVVLEKIIRQDIAEYTEKYLFTPLNIEDYRWERLNDDRVNGGAGLQLKAIDTAKIGLVLINKGVYNNTQIVSEEWLKQAASRKRVFGENFNRGPMTFNGYGYLWWKGTGAGSEINLASGWGGQLIATIPSENILVITNSRHDVFRTQAQQQEARNLSLIVNGILKAAN